MELGRHLVRELGFDEFNTLGRWMAHHVAELIEEAENSTSPAGRLKARQLATGTILKIWTHRKALPEHAYPLASYNELLAVLDRLRPGDNAFGAFGQDPEAKKDQLAALLFDNLTRLIIALLLTKIDSLEKATIVDAAAIEALSEEEQRVWEILLQWNELFRPQSTPSGRPTKSKKASAPAKIDLTKAAIQLVDAVTATLVELRKELRSTGKKGKPKHPDQETPQATLSKGER